jgi:CheY-like chemotaxis protein
MIVAGTRAMDAGDLPYLFGGGHERPLQPVNGRQLTPAKTGGTCRILVVDDEDLFRLSVVNELTARYGADVQWTRYGADAIAKAKASAGQLDLILLDVALIGKLDGLAVYKAIRAEGIKTPVIFMSAHYTEDTLRDIAATGATMFRKPRIDYGKIETVLRKCRGDAS